MKGILVHGQPAEGQRTGIGRGHIQQGGQFRQHDGAGTDGATIGKAEGLSRTRTGPGFHPARPSADQKDRHGVVGPGNACPPSSARQPTGNSMAE